MNIHQTNYSTDWLSEGWLDIHNNHPQPKTEQHVTQAPAQMAPFDIEQLQVPPPHETTHPRLSRCCLLGMMAAGAVISGGIGALYGLGVIFSKPQEGTGFKPRVMNGTNCESPVQPPASEWSFKLGAREIVPNSAQIPADVWDWAPDGHISSFPISDHQYAMIWPVTSSWRTIGDSPLPESMYASDPEEPVLMTFGGDNEWNEGGSWVMSSVPLPNNGLLGIVHGEYLWDVATNPDRIAWKTLGVTHSYDQGRSWSKPEKMVSAAAERPATPQWGGAGDASAIWDCREQRLIMYYSESGTGFKLTAAATHDHTGLSGWKKWNGAAFTEPGLGGAAAPLAGLSEQAGANPSIQWNRALDKWTMVWHGWDGNIYLSASSDAVHWERPRLVTEPSTGYDRAWYPTLIDEEGGDRIGDASVRLYHAEIKLGASRTDHRVFVARDVIFDV